jgi:hypothetical protein
MQRHPGSPAPPRPAQARYCPAALSRLASAASACPGNWDSTAPSRLPRSIQNLSILSKQRHHDLTLKIDQEYVTHLAIESHSLLPTDLFAAIISLLFKRTVPSDNHHNKIQQQNKNNFSFYSHSSSNTNPARDTISSNRQRLLFIQAFTVLTLFQVKLAQPDT